MASDEKYEEIVDGTIDEVKEAVSDNDLDPKKLLELEKDKKDRKTLKTWLKDRIDTESKEEKDQDLEGKEPSSDEQYCSSCGGIIKKEAAICPDCGVRNSSASKSNKKDRVVAGIFALLIGGLGAHKFYLGQTGLGLLYLCFFWTGIPAIIAFIEGIIYLTQTEEEFQENYVNV